MAENAGPALRQCHIVTSYNDIASFLVQKFDGWHHTHNNVGGISKTTHAVVNPSSDNCGAAIRKAITTCNAKHVSDVTARKSSPLTHFIYLLHNRGSSLQSRPDHMVLTRVIRVLVKGANAAHAATMCELDGYACLTEAYETIEGSVIKDIIVEIRRHAANQSARPHTMASVCMKQIGCIHTCNDMFNMALAAGRSPPVALAVNTLLCAAVLHTGFSDAGAKFRDRAARQEGGRHYGESLTAFLSTPMQLLCARP